MISNRTSLLAAAALGFMTLQVGAARAQVAPTPGAGGHPVVAVVAPADGLAKLRLESPGARISERMATGLDLMIPGQTVAERALAFVASHPGLFSLGDGGALVQGDVKGQSVRLVQTHGGLTVRRSGVTFAFDPTGRLKGYTNETRAIAKVVPAVITEAAAIAAAQATLNVTAAGMPPVVRRALMVRGGEATTIFEVDLLARPPLDVRRMLVDGVSGEVFGQEVLVQQ